MSLYVEFKSDAYLAGYAARVALAGVKTNPHTTIGSTRNDFIDWMAGWYAADAVAV